LDHSKPAPVDHQDSANIETAPVRSTWIDQDEQISKIEDGSTELQTDVNFSPLAVLVLVILGAVAFFGLSFFLFAWNLSKGRV
jgi:hypothetical protein